VLDVDPSTLRLCLASDPSQCTGAPRDVSLSDRGDPGTDLGAPACALIEVEDGVFQEQDYLNPDLLLDMDAAFEASEVRALIGSYCEQLDKGDPLPPLVLRGRTWDDVEVESTATFDTGIDQLIKVNR
jgi:hypothetical protein